MACPNFGQLHASKGELGSVYSEPFFTSLAGGEGHAILLARGQAFTWGRGEGGQLGLPSAYLNRLWTESLREATTRASIESLDEGQLSTSLIDGSPAMSAIVPQLMLLRIFEIPAWKLEGYHHCYTPEALRDFFLDDLGWTSDKVAYLTPDIDIRLDLVRMYFIVTIPTEFIASTPGMILNQKLNKEINILNAWAGEANSYFLSESPEMIQRRPAIDGDASTSRRCLYACGRAESCQLGMGLDIQCSQVLSEVSDCLESLVNSPPMIGTSRESPLKLRRRLLSALGGEEGALGKSLTCDPAFYRNRSRDLAIALSWMAYPRLSASELTCFVRPPTGPFDLLASQVPSRPEDILHLLFSTPSSPSSPPESTQRTTAVQTFIGSRVSLPSPGHVVPYFGTEQPLLMGLIQRALVLSRLYPQTTYRPMSQLHQRSQVNNLNNPLIPSSNRDVISTPTPTSGISHSTTTTAVDCPTAAMEWIGSLASMAPLRGQLFLPENGEARHTVIPLSYATSLRSSPLLKEPSTHLRIVSGASAAVLWSASSGNAWAWGRGTFGVAPGSSQGKQLEKDQTCKGDESMRWEELLSDHLDDAASTSLLGLSEESSFTKQGEILLASPYRLPYRWKAITLSKGSRSRLIGSADVPEARPSSSKKNPNAPGHELQGTTTRKFVMAGGRQEDFASGQISLGLFNRIHALREDDILVHSLGSSCAMTPLRMEGTRGKEAVYYEVQNTPWGESEEIGAMQAGEGFLMALRSRDKNGNQSE